MNEFKTNFIESQQNKPLVCCRYIDDVLLWAHVEEKSKRLLEYFNNFNPCLNFTHESRKQSL